MSFKLIFCRDYNLLMYLKATLARVIVLESLESRVKKLNNSNSNSLDSSFENNLSNVKNIQ